MENDSALVRRLEEVSIFDDEDDDMYEDDEIESGAFRRKVINKIKEFCIRMALEADPFMDKYETYEMRTKTQIRTLKDLDRLFAYIRSELQEQSDKRASNTVQNNIAKIKLKKEEEIIESRNALELYSSADIEFKEQPQLIETLIKPEGAEAMEIVEGDEDKDEDKKKGSGKGVGIEVVQNVPEYFYMNEPLDNKGRWLESLMERAKSDDIPYTKEETENTDEDNEDVLSRTTRFNVPIQDDVWAFGRICYEEPEENGIPPKMTAVNTLLQGPLSIGSPRVKIILSNAPKYMLFPGQIVGVKGNNPTGKLFVARDFITAPAYPRLNRPKEMNTGRRYRILAASGPFTTTKALNFKPFEMLVRAVIREAPDVFIVGGPFLDDGDARLATVSTSFSILFNELFMKHLNAIPASTQVVVVPGLQDATSDYPVLPQPPLSVGSYPKNPNILFAPNPAVVSIDGGAVTLGMTSVDVIKHISRHFVSGGHTDRMGCMCQALVEQRSFYPLQPTDESVAMEYSKLAGLYFPLYTPDVLLLPSDQNTFAKKVVLGCEEGMEEETADKGKETACCVNPGRVARGVSVGKFALIEVCAGGDVNKVEIYHL